jgi:hypothetical protein
MSLPPLIWLNRAVVLMIVGELYSPLKHVFVFPGTDKRKGAQEMRPIKSFEFWEED